MREICSSSRVIDWLECLQGHLEAHGHHGALDLGPLHILVDEREGGCRWLLDIKGRQPDGLSILRKCALHRDWTSCRWKVEEAIARPHLHWTVTPISTRISAAEGSTCQTWHTAIFLLVEATSSRPPPSSSNSILYAPTPLARSNPRSSSSTTADGITQGPCGQPAVHGRPPCSQRCCISLGCAGLRGLFGPLDGFCVSKYCHPRHALHLILSFLHTSKPC